MKTEAELKQIQMFGTTKAFIDESVKETLRHSRNTKIMIMGMISDLQEAEFSEEQTRQMLNVIKYLIDSTLTGKDA